MGVRRGEAPRSKLDAERTEESSARRALRCGQHSNEAVAGRGRRCVHRPRHDRGNSMRGGVSCAAPQRRRVGCRVRTEAGTLCESRAFVLVRAGCRQRAVVTRHVRCFERRCLQIARTGLAGKAGAHACEYCHRLHQQDHRQTAGRRAHAKLHPLRTITRPQNAAFPFPLVGLAAGTGKPHQIGPVQPAPVPTPRS